MYLSLGQAAKETGKSKSVISNALKSGRISGSKNDKGEWQIDPSELFRVFSKKNTLNSSEERNRTAENPLQNSLLEQEVNHLRELLDRERRSSQTIIDDLREDRNRWRIQAEQATRLLTDQREKVTEKEPAPQSTKIWAGLFIVVVIGLIILAASCWPVLQNVVTG